MAPRYAAGAPIDAARYRSAIDVTADEARSGLTDQHRWYLEAYGYLCFRGLLIDDLPQIATAFDELVADPDVPRIEWLPPGHHGRPQWMLGDVVPRHPTLAALPTDARILGLVHDLLGSDATYIGSDASVYACETDWHCDTPAVDRDLRHLKFAIYLDPIRQAHGAPRLLVGSHQLDIAAGGPLHRYLGYDGAVEERTGVHSRDLPHWALPSDPGDVLVWDFRVMHATFGTTEPRRQITLNYRATRPEAVGGIAT
ncbi:MAG: phytanoyl-CoA dioxygenase family protein [Actinobacteria bacterium]|nr:phytanoyl-CoA dioxygenase family protein [Actinomycetota bacterium]